MWLIDLPSSISANTYQLNNLVSSGIVEAYPPLVDVKGSYTAQYEHVSTDFPVGIVKILTFLRRFFCDQISKRSSAVATISEQSSHLRSAA
jgi:hypothetical protein